MSRADARLAAEIQADTWQEDVRTQHDAKLAASLQQELWQECEKLVVHQAKAVAQSLLKPTARPLAERIPMDEEVIQGATQLDWTLSDYGLRQRDILGDGACQFRAIADQLYGDQELHGMVRDRAADQLRANPGKYAGFAVGEDFNTYVARMTMPDTWGDNLTLQAIADALNLEICIISSFSERSFLRISPCSRRRVQQAWLGFYAEYHYTSLEPL